MLVLILVAIAEHALRLRLRAHDRLAAILGHAVRALLRRSRFLALACVFLLLALRRARSAVIAARLGTGGELGAHDRVLHYDRTTDHWRTRVHRVLHER